MSHLLSALLLLMPTTALSQELAVGTELEFEFRRGLLQCVNKGGISGFNKNRFNECGDHRGQVFQNRDFRYLNMRGSQFSSSEIIFTRFNGAKLFASSFEKASLIECDFSSAKLGKANFRFANLQNSSFVWADLRGADIRGADFSETDLRGAELFLVNWNSKTKFTGAIYDIFTKLPFSDDVAKSKGMIFDEDISL